jgi:hypothetical protein
MEANKKRKCANLPQSKLNFFKINNAQICILPLPVTMFKRDIPVAIGPVHQSAKMLR